LYQHGILVAKLGRVGRGKQKIATKLASNHL